MIKKIIKGDYIIEIPDTTKYTDKEIDQIIEDSLAILKRKKEVVKDSRRDLILGSDYKYNEFGPFYLSEFGFKNADNLDANDMFVKSKSHAHHFESLEDLDAFCHKHGIEDYFLLEKIHDSDVDDTYVEDEDIEIAYKKE